MFINVPCPFFKTAFSNSLVPQWCCVRLNIHTWQTATEEAQTQNDLLAEIAALNTWGCV